MTSMRIAVAALVAAAALAGCKKSSTAPSGPPAGAERGACRSGGGCDPGLTCLSDLCVRPPQADCAAVAKQLGYLFLDNYAPREERDAFAAEVTKACKEKFVSESEGACLVAAKTRVEVRDCPKPLGIGDCAKIQTYLEGLRQKSTVDAYLVTAADRVISRCKGEAPSLAFERCVLQVTNLDDVERCTW